MQKHWVAVMVMAGFALAATQSDAAKRAGSGKDSGTQRPAATAAKKKGEEEVTTKRSSTPTISVNRSGSPSAQPSVIPAVAAGAAVGAVMATSARPAGASAAPDTEAARRQGEEKLKRAIEDEEKAKQAEEKKVAAIAEREKQDAEERRKVAQLAAEKKAKAEKEKREALCVIRPVMTDNDIANCRQASR